MVRVQTTRKHYRGANFRTVWRTLQEIGEKMDKFAEERAKEQAEATRNRAEEERRRAEEERRRAEERAEEERKRAEERAEEERRRAEEERKRAEEERKRAEEERKRAEERAEAERKWAEEERRRAEERAEEERKWAEEERKRAEEQAKANREFEAKMKAEREKNEKEIAELHKKAEMEHEKTERVMRRVDRQIGEMTNRFGELAEHLVAPGIIKRFNELGYHFDDIIAQNVIIQNGQGKELAEIDLLCENGEYSLATEVKSYPVLKDIPHHTKRLQILRAHKDRRGDKRIIRGAVAGAVFPQDVQEAALEAGFYVIVQSGDTMKIQVPEGFKPKDF